MSASLETFLFPLYADLPNSLDLDKGRRSSKANPSVQFPDKNKSSLQTDPRSAKNKRTHSREASHKIPKHSAEPNPATRSQYKPNLYFPHLLFCAHLLLPACGLFDEW